MYLKRAIISHFSDLELLLHRRPLCAFKAFNSKVKRTCPWEGGGGGVEWSPPTLEETMQSCTQHKHFWSYSDDVLDFSTSSCLVFQKRLQKLWRNGDWGRKSFCCTFLALGATAKTVISQKSSGVARMSKFKITQTLSSQPKESFDIFGNTPTWICVLVFARIS